jgi:hypothetical protein
VAKLNYQSYDQKVADKLLATRPIIVPTVEMKALTRAYGADLKVAEGPCKVAQR